MLQQLSIPSSEASQQGASAPQQLVTVSVAVNTGSSFTINEFIRRIQLLIKTEMSKRKCQLKEKIEVSEDLKIDGNAAYPSQ